MLPRKLLIDSNIVLDHVARREPYDIKASLLLMLGYLKEFELWFSASQVTDIFYVLTRAYGSSGEQAASAIRRLRQAIRVYSMTELDIDSALDLGWEDFEDACIYQAARKLKVNAIITRNKSDFARSIIPVYTAEEFFAYLESEEAIVYEEVELV